MREPRNRVVQVGRFGDPDGLEVVDAPLPTAGRGEVRVRVLASSVQYTDVLIRRHLYPQTAARRLPFHDPVRLSSPRLILAYFGLPSLVPRAFAAGMAKRRNGVALDRRRHDGGSQRLPSIESL